ncbi:putative nucleoside triphosphate hydrolase superfamily/ P-loop domain protein [Giardia duodenalis assemblage B]|uniref:Putative nucleoside triphosphate hydrolase superfamily/ P-loop domain protein n=1 Tax=Giardia duodenalis assemblage B TaxID=1394984 RepID=A0A132NME8_GIAIN|nr:putative nucleoside triphosphate hydrolase superfamily/ P-loop domain protein [Giardia intestinalis assemblage B]
MPPTKPPSRTGGAPPTRTSQTAITAESYPTLRTVFVGNADVTLPEREGLVLMWATRILRKLKEGYDSNPPVCCTTFSLDTITLKGDEIDLRLRSLPDRYLSQIQDDNLRSLAVLIYEAYTGKRLIGYGKLREYRRQLPDKLQKCVEKCGHATVDEVLEKLDSSSGKQPKRRSNSKHAAFGANRSSDCALKSHEPDAPLLSRPAFSSAAEVSNALAEASAARRVVEHTTLRPMSIPPTTPIGELSILLIGESGVGKSILINMFALCSRFSELREIPLANMSWPTPVHFAFDGVEVSTKGVGAKILGGSDTQVSQDYRFDYALDGSPIRVCVIDTPGMGDTRGLEKDAENMRNIIKHLSQHRALHGVCFLLKPNDSRFTVFLKYCIEELLKHFHKNILDNVVIGFTHTRGTLYRPGDTLPSLKSYFSSNGINLPLERETLYCFDSEIVRLITLCSQNAGLITNEMCSVSAESWHKTREELARMFGYISKLTPHNVKETVDFDVTLRVSEELVRKLPELLADLKNEKKEMKEARGYLEDLRKGKQLLEGRVQVSKRISEDRDLKYLRLRCVACRRTCYNSDCLVANYKAANLYGKMQIKDKLRERVRCKDKWYFIYQNLCERCWHSLSSHEVVLTEKSFYNKMVEDEDVKKKLAECKSEEQEFNTLLEESKKRIDSYTRACATINKALQVCRQFLVENSIIDPQQQLKNLQHRLEEMRNHAIYESTDSTAEAQIQSEIKYYESMIAAPGTNSATSRVSLETVQHCIETLKRTDFIGEIVSKIASLEDDTNPTTNPDVQARRDK